MKNLLKFLLSIQIIFNISFALNCSSVEDVKEYNGHYYVITAHKITFLEAKQFAEDNDGYLAIPNDSAENNFLKSLLPGASYGWIGVYDIDNMTNYCYGDENCAYDDSRFVDIKGNALTYTNWADKQPDNLVRPYDVKNGMLLVTPLGEHWVAMSSLDGKWADFGNHADEYNNPVKFYAIIEFDKQPDCYTPPSDVNETYEGAKCNTQIWDDKSGILSDGETYTCLEDKNNNYYCPAALAPCGDSWDYKDSYPVEHIGHITDQTASIKQTETKTTTNYISCSDVNSKGISLLCKDSWRWSCSHIRADGGCYQYFCPDPTKVKNGKVCWGPNGEFCKDIGGVFGDKQWEFLGACSDNDRCCYKEKNKRWNYVVINPISANQSYTSTSTITTYTCPAGYKMGADNKCYQDKTYKYYQYLCSGTNYYGEPYMAINSGYTTYTKTDPDPNNKNPELSNDVNSPTPPPNNCKAKSFTCKPAPDRKCAWVDNKWQCSPFPCFGAGAGDYDVSSNDTPVGANDSDNNGWNDDGSCSGTIYIFSGKDMRCRSDDVFFGLTGGGCCNKDKVFAGLVQCKEDEKNLAKKRDKDMCHYVGEYCSKELDLAFTKICIQHKQTYCCFNSKLARIINEQGRPQIGKTWGSGDSPNCRGFKPEEFQKLDFSKMDLSEFYKDISDKVSSSVTKNLGSYIKDSVSSHLDSLTQKTTLDVNDGN